MKEGGWIVADGGWCMGGCRRSAGERWSAVVGRSVVQCVQRVYVCIASDEFRRALINRFIALFSPPSAQSTVVSPRVYGHLAF